MSVFSCAKCGAPKVGDSDLCHAHGGSMDAKHTPTPWIVGRKADYWDVKQKNGFLESEVATCLRKENAAFIVRAVNSHEALLTNLKAALIVLESNPMMVHSDIVTSIRKAIAQAEQVRS